VADAGGADHQAAIRGGGGYVGELFGAGQQGSGADCGPCFAVGDVVGGDDAQALEAEIGHGPGGGADVQRVAGAYQDDPQVVFPVGIDVPIVLRIGERRCNRRCNPV
jgi:hypothetical protein